MSCNLSMLTSVYFDWLLSVTLTFFHSTIGQMNFDIHTKRYRNLFLSLFNVDMPTYSMQDCILNCIILFALGLSYILVTLSEQTWTVSKHYFNVYSQWYSDIELFMWRDGGRTACFSLEVYLKSLGSLTWSPEPLLYKRALHSSLSLSLFYSVHFCFHFSPSKCLPYHS